MAIFRSFVEETCLCGRVWRGKPGCSFGCDQCGEDTDNLDLEEFEENRRRKIAERNEY